MDFRYVMKTLGAMMCCYTFQSACQGYCTLYTYDEARPWGILSLPSVILNMIDWSQAFERQSHFLGIKSFIKNGVRKSLIPLLINFFQERNIMVKWKNCFSQSRTVTGGGPQGGTAGIVEYISQTNGNFDFLPNDEKFKFVDDASFLEILNLIAIGLSSFNAKLQVPSDLSADNLFLPTDSTSSQTTLNKISQWTTDNQM